MGKSLEEIWEKMQKELQEKKELELLKEKELYELKEKQRQEYMKRQRMFESLTSLTSVSSAAAGGVGYQEYISVTDTIWLYPQADLDAHISTYIFSGGVYQTAPGLSPSVSFTKTGNVYSFPTVSQLAIFYGQVYLQTEISQPVGNLGFSCGVGTTTKARSKDRIILKLDSGIKVVEWALMIQTNSQSSLPVGGNSPDGTVGWGSIYCDWDLDGVQDPTSAAANSLSNLIDGLVFKPN